VKCVRQVVLISSDLRRYDATADEWRVDQMSPRVSTMRAKRAASNSPAVKVFQYGGVLHTTAAPPVQRSDELSALIEIDT